MFKETDSVRMMGTTIHLMAEGWQAGRIIERMKELLEQYNHRFSANDDGSELAQVNQAAGQESVQVHPELFELIQIGKQHSLPEDSFLNIAIGPLIKLWRIGFDDANVPSDQAIKQVMKRIDVHQVELDATTHTVKLAQPKMELDLGALAKGYIADKIMADIQSFAPRTAFINLGGNLLLSGKAHHHPDNLWRVGIQHPDKPRGQNCMILKLPACSVVTSGIYERRLIAEDGREFHHVFDTNTGRPIATDLASITIISPTSLEGEIWTTRLFGHDKATILQQVEALDRIEAIVIDQQHNIAYTSGIKSRIDAFL